MLASLVLLVAACSTTTVGMVEVPIPPAVDVPAPPSTTATTVTVTPVSTTVPTGTSAPGSPSTAAAALALLPVKGKAPLTGYHRDLFGQRWSDDVEVGGGHNGCDTRNDILRRDMFHAVIKPNTQGCVVAGGLLDDPYTGEQVVFLRGQGTSADVQIDHVVALANAWQTGARQLTPERRAELANDPLELLAVQGKVNQAKGSGDAATWLPPNKTFRCRYVARQVAVKRAYDLWVTPAERDAIARVLDGCPGEPLPSASDVDVVVSAPIRS